MLKSTRCPPVGPPTIGTGTNFMPSEFTKGSSRVAAANVPADGAAPFTKGTGTGPERVRPRTIMPVARTTIAAVPMSSQRLRPRALPAPRIPSMSARNSAAVE